MELEFMQMNLGKKEKEKEKEERGERGGGEEEEVNQYWPGNDNVTHKGRGGRGWRSHLIAFDVS